MRALLYSPPCPQCGADAESRCTLLGRSATPLDALLFAQLHTLLSLPLPPGVPGAAEPGSLREELLRRVNVAVYPAKVEAVLFKDVIVQ